VLCFTESKAVTITTYAKDRVQRRAETSDGSEVEAFETTRETKYFTLGPEYVVIKVGVATWLGMQGFIQDFRLGGETFVQRNYFILDHM